MNRIVLVLAFAFLSVWISKIGFAQTADQRQAYWDAIKARNAVIELAAEGDLESYKAAIAKDPNALNFRWRAVSKGDEFNGETALHFAAKNSDLPMLEFLLNSKADIHQGTVTGDTPLHYAASEQVAKVLIEAGAKVGAKGNLGRTPLHKAATKKIAEVLVANGAKIDQRSDGYSTLAGKTPEGETPLQVAAWDGRPEVAAYLIQQGADVNATSDGDTALSIAALGRLEVVKVLLANGARVNGFQPQDSPLRNAVENCQTGIVKLLLNAKADSLGEDRHGWNLLHIAANDSNCDAELIEILIDSGLGIDKITNSKDTALQLAARSANLTAARVLLAKGADIKNLNDSGSTALMISQKKIEGVKPYSIQGTAEQVQGAQRGHSSQVQQFIDRRKKIAALIEQAAKSIAVADQ